MQKQLRVYGEGKRRRILVVEKAILKTYDRLTAMLNCSTIWDIARLQIYNGAAATLGR